MRCTLRSNLSALALVLFACLGTHINSQDRAPWEKSSSEVVLRPPANPLEIFARFDIGASQLENFVSGQPLQPNEEDVLVKILYRFPRLGLDNLQRWQQRGVSYDNVVAAPADHRGEVFRISGRAQRVEILPLLPEQKVLFEFDHYYLVTVALEGAPYQAQVATRKIPQAWPVNAPIDEPTAADALFLKLGDESLDPPPLFFAAGSLGWYPDKPHAEQHIGPPQLALAKLGLDVSLWDDIRASKDHALTSADREGFYQLLHVLGQNDHSPLAPHPSPLEIVSLLERPQNHFGETMSVEGVARRAMRIAVTDADINSRYGIDHYYEIDLFVPLGDTSLRFGKSEKMPDKAGPVYRNTFPVTLIARELPAGLTTGEDIHEVVRADGVFFKTWAYRSAYSGQFNQLQPAPMLITRKPQLVTISTKTNWVSTALVTTACVLGLGVILLIFFVFNRSDRAARASSQQLPTLPPDFSHLK
jgi:hypothetical protein